MKKNEMGGKCSTYGKKRRSVYRVVMGKRAGRRMLGRLCVVGRILLKWVYINWMLWCGL
jgi:hypothetical protein